MRVPANRFNGLGATINALQTAKSNLQAAGYDGVECRTETVSYPGGSYDQDICSAPGYTGGIDATLASKMTPAQLAAQNAYEQAAGAGSASTPDYFQMTAGAPNMSVSQTTAASGPTAPVQSDWLTTWQQTQNTLTTAANTPAAPANKTTTSGNQTDQSTPATTNNSSLVSGIPDTYLYIGAALVAFMLLRK